MLDEEVVIKTPRHASERLLIINVILLSAISALCFGGTSSLGMGLLVAAGILAPINMIVFKSVWIDAPPNTNFHYTLALFPYLVSFAIMVGGLLSPSIEELTIGSQSFYCLITENTAPITSATPDFLSPFLSELSTLAIVACALSIYFITESRYIIRYILIFCGLIAVALALLGFAYDAIRVQSPTLSIPFLGTLSFSTFPDKFHWTSYATIWMGAFLAISLYTGQKFTFKQFFYSLRFMCIVCAGILFASILYCATPLQEVVAYILAAISFMFLAIDTFPAIANLNRHYPQRSWSAPKKRFIRGSMPMYVYSLLSVACFALAVWSFVNSYTNPSERLLVDSSDKYSMTLPQRKSLILNAESLVKDRQIFGWGTSSYTTVMAFNQDSDFGNTPWLSPKCDILQKLVENGIVGIVLQLITPLAFFIIWLFRRDFSLSGTTMLLTVLAVSATGMIDFPFQSPAVMLGIWILMMSAFGWDNAEMR